MPSLPYVHLEFTKSQLGSSADWIVIYLDHYLSLEHYSSSFGSWTGLAHRSLTSMFEQGNLQKFYVDLC